MVHRWGGGGGAEAPGTGPGWKKHLIEGREHPWDQRSGETGAEGPSVPTAQGLLGLPSPRWPTRWLLTSKSPSTSPVEASSSLSTPPPASTQWRSRCLYSCSTHRGWFTATPTPQAAGKGQALRPARPSLGSQPVLSAGVCPGHHFVVRAPLLSHGLTSATSQGCGRKMTPCRVSGPINGSCGRCCN